MSAIDELLENNAAYAHAFDHADLPSAPAKKVAVVACMDARLIPTRVLGLEEGDAHVIRNAGGVITDDEIRLVRVPPGTWRGYEGGPAGLEILVFGAPISARIRAKTWRVSATGGLTSARSNQGQRSRIFSGALVGNPAFPGAAGGTAPRTSC